MAKAYVHILILHLCMVAIFCGRNERVEKRLKAIQTLLFQDMQSVIEGIDKSVLKTESLKESVDENTLKIESLKESVDNNTLKIDSLTDLINQKLTSVTHTVAPRAESKHDIAPPTEIIENSKEETSTPAYVKRLQRAFQTHKKYSLSFQVNILTQFEKTIRNKDALIKNVTKNLFDLKSQMKDVLDDMRLHMDKMAVAIPDDQVNVAPTSLSSVECSRILGQTGEILKEVNRSRNIISDSISALKIPKQDKSDQIPSSCFKIQSSAEKDVSNVNDDKCIDINVEPGKKFTYHCDNRNMRIGDAIVTEVGVEGRVEVRYNNHWGTVCRYGFGDDDATVACKMAGFARGVYVRGVPRGSGQIWLANLWCEGHETDLFDCDRYRSIGAHDCTHTGDVGVRCFWLA